MVKPPPHRIHFITAAVVACSLAGLLGTQTAHAASSAWGVDASGAWNLSTNWAGSTIADGSGFTATFANDITADRTVTLGVDRTIGSLTFGDSNTSTAGSWLLTGNTLTLSSTHIITVNALGTGKTVTISSVIAGGAGFTKAGTGTLILTNANTYTGGTVISGGTLIVTNTAALSPQSLTLSGGGVFDVQTDGGDIAKTVSVGNGNAGTIASDVATGTVGIDHSLGTLNISSSTTLTITKGINVASGSPSITFATVALSAGAAGTSIIKPTTANLMLGDVSSTSNFAKTLQLDGTSTGNAVTGTISDGTNVVSLTKANTSTWTLGGANTYSGTTTVSGGTLAITGSTGSGAVTAQNGSTILGTGSVHGSSFTAQSGSTVQAGNDTAQSSYGTLNFTPVSGSGSFDFQSGSSVILGINPGGTGDLLNFNGLSAGTLNFNGNLQVTATGYIPTSVQTFNLLDWANLTTVTFANRYSSTSYSGYLLGNGDDNLGFDLPDISGSGYAWDISHFTTDGTISTIAIVPEPARILLLCLGLMGLVLRRKRHS